MERVHQVLLDGLTQEREHILGALEGLSDQQLRQPVLPSGWTCLGLVKHMALAVEHYWFSCIMGGDPLEAFLEAVGEDEWHVADDEAPERVFALYRDEIGLSNALIEAAALDTPPRQRDPRWESWQMDFPDLVRIMTHTMNETACHAGHIDAVRELLDGSQWIAV